MSVFVTTMYRYGDREKHSYVLGVWSSSEVAMQAGQTEALWRGGKYEPEVTEWNIGEQRPTKRAADGALPSYNCECGFIVAIGETECMRCHTPRR